MKTITRKQIIFEIARRKGMDPKDVQRIITEFLHAVTDNLVEGNRFEFRDFGVFEVVERKSKIGRNPKSPEVPILIPERKTVKFSPGRKLKNLISNSG